MDEERKIKVYIKVNNSNEITEINSEIFIRDLSGWIFVDEGTGDRYAHAQGHYLSDTLTDEKGKHNYIYFNGKIIKK